MGLPIHLHLVINHETQYHTYYFAMMIKSISARN